MRYNSGKYFKALIDVHKNRGNTTVGLACKHSIFFKSVRIISGTLDTKNGNDCMA